MVFYKMGKAALLEGLPENVDISSAWLLVATRDDGKAKTFQEKFGIKLTSKFRHVPVSSARMLAKIGYCHLLTELEPGYFRPICLPYILGTKPNPSYVIGGSLEIAPPDNVGYILRTAGFGSTERLMLIAEIRLFSNNSTPTYHVLVGDVSGQQQVASVLEKIGPFAQIGGVSASSSDKDSPWAPRVWPLPFWNAA